MKLSNPFGALFSAVLLAALFTSLTAQAITADASATNTSSGIQVAPAPATEHPSAARFSPGAQEIVNMLEAKVDPEVIKAYIKNSPVPYNLSASEIIDLKSHGVPDDMLAAMLQRGTEIRAHAVASSQPGPVTTPAPYPMTSQYQYPQSQYQYPQYPEANYDYGTSYYGGYPYYYPYYYPYSYYWYNYGYPWYGYYYPYYYYPYCHFDGHGFCHFHHSFHNGGHWGSHGGTHPSPQGPNHSSAFGTFAGRNSGFSGTRAMGSFGTFAPQRSGFASAPSASRASMAFSAARPTGFASHAGGFSGHVGGGFRAGGGGGGGRGGGGGHR
jgi:hypothetical protein